MYKTLLVFDLFFVISVHVLNRDKHLGQMLLNLNIMIIAVTKQIRHKIGVVSLSILTPKIEPSL